MTRARNIPMRDAFMFFRPVWSRAAAFHLARVRFGVDWRDRWASLCWLGREGVPVDGAAPSLNFRGLPLNTGA